MESENLIRIESIMKGKKPAVWAAWGTLITKRPYLLNSLYKIMDLSKEYNCKWYNAGPVSKMGHPHHPLYLDKTIKLNEFDITLYVEKASIELAFSAIKNIKNNTLHSESDFLEVLDKAGFMEGY